LKTTLEITDEVNVRFHGLDMKVRRKMVDALKFFIPSAYHTPAYKLGRWDGTVSYCGLGGQTQLNLLDRVLPVVVEAGYEIEIDDHRQHYDFNFQEIHENWFAELGKVWPKGHPAEGQPIVLRDYQIKIVNEFITNRQGIQEAATGAGKTLVTAALSNLVEAYGRSVVIVPNKSLVVQTEEDYINLGLDVGVYFGERKELNRTHTICTWQSLEHMVKAGKGLPKDEQPINVITDGVVCVMVDEAHMAKADVLRNLLTGPFANVPLRFGLTGTIPKDEYQFISMLGAIGPVLGHLSAKELQDAGVLSNCHVNVVQTIDLREFGGYPEEYKYLTTDAARIKWLATTVRSISETGNTLILLDRIKCGDMLQELLNEGVAKDSDDYVPFISGTVKLTDRKKEYDDVKTSSNKIIIASFGVAAVGINVPRIFNLILFEPGKSFVRVIQSIGRGIRKAADKDSVLIWDVCSTTKHSKRHLTKRKVFYKDAQYPFTIKKVDLSNENIVDLFGDKK